MNKTKTSRINQHGHLVNISDGKMTRGTFQPDPKRLTGAQESVTINGIKVPPLVRITNGYLKGLDAPVVKAEPCTIGIHYKRCVGNTAAVRIWVWALHPTTGEDIYQAYHVANYIDNRWEDKGELFSQFLATADPRFPLELA